MVVLVVALSSSSRTLVSVSRPRFALQVVTILGRLELTSRSTEAA